MSVRRHFLAPLLGAGEVHGVLRNERTGELVANHIEMASDSKKRRRGLLGRTALSQDTVLIIAPCNAVHTFFMKFAIDVVFASRDGRVLKICPRVPPWRIGAALRAFAALELAAGAAERAGISVGDRLGIETTCADN